MIFRQLFDKETSTYTYILADEESREAVLIDSVYEQVERDSVLLQELGLKLKYLLETHVHADHVTGVSQMKKHFPQAQSAFSHQSGVQGADIFLKEEDTLQFGKYNLRAIEVPGHTNGCMAYYTEANGGMVFTGDALLIRGCGRTDFQQGDPGMLYDSIQKLFALPENTSLYPGHNYKGLTSSSIVEEKEHNPRLAHKSKAEFIEIMSNLNLSQPKQIDIAVPANLLCGQMQTNE